MPNLPVYLHNVNFILFLSIIMIHANFIYKILLLTAHVGGKYLFQLSKLEFPFKDCK